MDIPPQLFELLGALAIAAPLTARAFKKNADAKADGAAADKKIAEAVDKALSTITGLNEKCEARVKAQEERISALEAKSELDGLRASADAAVIESFTAKIVQDEAIINGLRKEMSDLRAEVRSGNRGGRYA